MIIDFKKIEFKSACLKKATALLLNARCTPEILNKIERMINRDDMPYGIMIEIFAILEKKKRHDIIKKWRGLDKIKKIFGSMSSSFLADREQWKKMDVAVLEMIIAGLKGKPIKEKSALISDQEFLAISALWSAMKIGETPAGNYFDLFNEDYREEFLMTVHGAALALEIQHDRILSEAEIALNRLKNGEAISLFDLLSDVDVTPDWSLAKDSALDGKILANALNHPNQAVAITAAELINAGAGGIEAVKAVEEVLHTGGTTALFMIRRMAPQIWGDRSLDIILHRLNGKLSYGCEHLLESLPHYLKEEPDERIYQIFLKCLINPNVEIALASIKGYSKYQPMAEHEKELKNAFEYWKNHEKPYPVKGGVIPKSPRKELVQVISQLKGFSVTELAELCNDTRGDVKDAAIDALFDIIISDVSELPKIIKLIENKEIPVRILSKITELPNDLVKNMEKVILELLESPHSDIRAEALKIIRKPWIFKEEVKELATKYLNDPDSDVRDQALYTLRAINDM